VLNLRFGFENSSVKNIYISNKIYVFYMLLYNLYYWFC